MINILDLSVPVAILSIVLFAALCYYQWKNTKATAEALGERSIEIDQAGISVKTKDTVKRYNLEDINSIWITGVGLSEQGMNPNNIIRDKNVLKCDINGSIKQFDFIIDSEYMVLQLNKILNRWKEQGLIIERL